MSPALRALRLSVLLGVTGALAGCASFAPVVREPMRIGNLEDASAEALGFVVGRTTLDQARSTLRDRGFTGVAESEIAPDGLPRLAVLGADYQRRVHVFRGGVYLQSLELPDQGFPPYGLVVRAGVDRTGPLVMALYRDPLGRRELPPVLQSYRDRGGSFELAGRASLGGLAERHGGMTTPVLVGGAIEDGLLLVARDRRGVLWDRGYLLRTQGERVRLQPMPMTSALRCSCVDAYSFQAKGI